MQAENESSGSQLTSIDLLCCPFCGDKPEITKHFREEMWRLLHRCKIVGAISFDWSENFAWLVSRWNTRAT
jgi:predicted  nucleic acid-binding Zn ribbon protein